VGRICAQSGVSWLIAVRGDARFFVEGPSRRDSLLAREIFPDAKLAGEFCQTLIAPDDVILVKGSRAVHLETVIEMLKRQNPGVRSQEPEGRNQNPAVRSQESEGGSQ